MEVARWKSPTPFFPWLHVQKSLDAIDAQVYRAAVEFAQEAFLAQARPCPNCGRSPAELFWVNIADAEPAWDAGTGRVGWLILCRRCKSQVDFLIDPELTANQAEQWRDHRTLY